MKKRTIKLDWCRKCHYACDGNKDHRCKSKVELSREALKADIASRKENGVYCIVCGVSILGYGPDRILLSDLCYKCEVDEHFKKYRI